VEDFALMQMGFENGVTATITTGRYGRQTDPAGGVDKVLVVGTEGSIVADGSPPNAAVYATAGSDGKSATRVNGSDASGVTTLLDELAWAIDRGHHPPNNVDHGVAQIETLLAGYKSYFTGEVVTLPLE
jgi:predicted dehydrogenase